MKRYREEVINTEHFKYHRKENDLHKGYGINSIIYSKRYLSCLTDMEKFTQMIKEKPKNEIIGLIAKYPIHKKYVEQQYNCLKKKYDIYIAKSLESNITDYEFFLNKKPFNNDQIKSIKRKIIMVYEDDEDENNDNDEHFNFKKPIPCFYMVAQIKIQRKKEPTFTLIGVFIHKKHAEGVREYYINSSKFNSNNSVILITTLDMHYYSQYPTEKIPSVYYEQNRY
jgi:hypothetical protein